MPSTLDWIPGKLLQQLIFSKYKTGKTWCALTFPRPNVMDFDRGIATARNPEFVKQYGLLDIQYEQFRDKFDRRGVPTAHDAFDSACVYFDKWMALGKRDQFDTWVIDSGSTLGMAALYKSIILLGNAEATKEFGQRSGTWTAAKKHGLIIPKIQDYGAERSQMEQFVAMVMDSDKNFVLVCHEKELTDDEGNLVGIVPLLTGKSVETVPIMFDEVYSVESKPVGMERTYTLITHPIGVRKVGTRYGVPDGTPATYEGIKAALDKIRAEQQAQAHKG